MVTAVSKWFKLIKIIGVAKSVANDTVEKWNYDHQAVKQNTAQTVQVGQDEHDSFLLFFECKLQSA